MRALTYEGPREIAVSEVADPTPMGLDGAVVRVALCGICGSDLHIYDGHGFSADLGFCVGHEAVGEVVEVGSAVRGFRVGDRVLVPASTGCGQCGPCRTGHVAACERGMAGCYGLGARLPGSQAEAVAVPAADHNLVTIPDAIGDEAALLLTDNLPTAWYGVRRARIAPGDTVAVVGCGGNCQKDADCDDKNACTGDSCTAGKCAILPLDGTPCDDGTACTQGDACAKNKCVGTPLNCDDKNPCTDDSCDVQKGCVNVNNIAGCDEIGRAHV